MSITNPVVSNLKPSKQWSGSQAKWFVSWAKYMGGGGGGAFNPTQSIADNDWFLSSRQPQGQADQNLSMSELSKNISKTNTPDIDQTPELR